MPLTIWYLNHMTIILVPLLHIMLIGKRETKRERERERESYG